MSDHEQQECTCHISPPCGFCTSLTEEEADVFAKRGAWAVLNMRREREEQMPHDPEPYPVTKSMSTGTERRRQILAEIEKCVCRDRQNTYGDAEDNLGQIARYWSEWKGVEFTALDVAAMMVFVKISRMKTSPLNLDNWIDAAGYAVCGGGIASKANGNQIVDPPHLSDKSTGA